MRCDGLLCFGSNKKIGDLARGCVAVFEQEKGRKIALDVRPFETTLSYRADNTKFTNTFGFTPARTLRDTILETWNALDKGHDHTNPCYYNDLWYTMRARHGSAKRCGS